MINYREEHGIELASQHNGPAKDSYESESRRSQSPEGESELGSSEIGTDEVSGILNVRNEDPLFDLEDFDDPERAVENCVRDDLEMLAMFEDPDFLKQLREAFGDRITDEKFEAENEKFKRQLRATIEANLDWLENG